MTTTSQHPLPRFRRSLFLRALLPLSLPGLALAGPDGGVVVGGSASIGTPDALTTVIDQTSSAAAINWQSFNVGGDEFVVFNQPSASSVVLNRVVGGDASTILGNVSANGRVFLVNPAGVLFGQGATVDVGGLVATTLDIANEDFLSGNYVFAQPAEHGGAVANAGTLTAADGGFVVLAGAQASNSGLIQARLGQVVLAGASALTLDVEGSGLVGYEITQGTLAAAAGVSNVGQILAQGGRVVMAANLARELIGSAVNNGGLVRAGGIAEEGGTIILTAVGGDVRQAGTLDVSGSASADAGRVDIRSDADIVLAAGSQVRASGAAGGEVLAIADGMLSYESGASIDVARQSSDRAGGFVELSGHERVRIRDTVSLGEHGRLLIDPPTLTLGESNTEPDITYDQLEAQLQDAQPGSVVQLVAENLITFRDVLDGVIDGSTTDPASGAGLLVGIGTADGSFVRGTDGSILFEDQTDVVRVDGSIELFTGSVSGDVFAGGLEGGSVSVNSAGALNLGVASVIGSDLFSSINLVAESGDLEVGDVSGGFVNLTSNNGRITAGNVTASVGGASLFSRNADINDDASEGQVSGIRVGNVSAIDGLSLTSFDANGTGAGSGITALDLQSGRNVSVSTTSGDLSLGNIAVSAVDSGYGGDVSNLSLSSYAGAVSTGDLTVVGGSSGSRLSVIGTTITVGGDVSVVGGGGTVSAYASYTSDDVAYAFLGSAGAVTITGNVGLTASAVSQERANEFSTLSRTFGGAGLLIDGGSVDLQGDIDILGVGESEFEVFSGSDVTLGGTTTITATESTRDSRFQFDVVEESRLVQGDVFVQIESLGTVTAGDMVIDGASIASLEIGANQIVLGDADATTLAVDLSAAAQGITPVDERIIDGVTVIDTSLGAALINLVAGPAGIQTTGGLSATGPVAGLGLFTTGAIAVDGDLRVTGTGYRIEGDPRQSFLLRQSEEDENSAADFPQIPLGPLLDTGTVDWGGAGLVIGSFDPELGLRGSAARLDLTGDLLMSGIGETQATIDAIEVRLGDIVMSASAGQVQGSRTDEEVIDGNLYDVTRSFDDGSGGGARYGHVGVDINTDGGLIEAGNVSLTGLSARFGIDDLGGGGSLQLGDVAVTGTQTAGLTRMRQVTSYADSQSDQVTAPPLATTTTLIDGNLNGFEAGLFSQPLASVSIGNLSVSGLGFSGIAINALSTRVGQIELSALAGEFSTDDLRTYGETFQSPLGEAAILLGGSGQAAEIAGLQVSTDNHLYLGLNVIAESEVVLDVGGALSQALPDLLIQDPHPFDQYTFTLRDPFVLQPELLSVPPPVLITLPGSNISALRIAVNFGLDSTLSGLGLSATGGESVEIDGAGTALSIASNLTLAGQSVRLSNLALNVAGTLDIVAGDLVDGLAIELVEADVQVDPSAGRFVLDAGRGSIRITDSRLSGQSGELVATGAVDIERSILAAPGEVAIVGDGVSLIDTSLNSAVISIDAFTDLVLDRSVLARESADGPPVPADSIDLGAGANLRVLSSTLSGPLSATVGGGSLFDNSLLIGDLALVSDAGIEVLNGTVMDGATGSLESAGSIRLSGIDSRRNPILNFSDALIVSAGGPLRVESAVLGLGQARAASGGDLLLKSPSDLTLVDSTFLGNVVTFEGRNISLQDSFVSGGPTQFLLAGGVLGDGGEGSDVDADSLLVSGASDILLGASNLVVGSGTTAAGTGDAGLLAELAERGLAPESSDPSAALLATNAIEVASLSLAGDYLLLQGDRIDFGEGGLQGPSGFLLQYLAGTPGGKVSLENQRSTLGVLNLGAQSDFPADGAVVVIGGSGFDGDILVGQNGSVSPLAGTDLVLFTSGIIDERTPTSRDSGEVVILGTLVTPPTVDEPNDKVDAIQSEISPEPPPDVPVITVLLTEEELIERRSAGPEFEQVCQ